MEADWGDLGSILDPLYVPNRAPTHTGAIFSKFTRFVFWGLQQRSGTAKERKKEPKCLPKGSLKETKYMSKINRFLGSICGSIWVAGACPRGTQRHPRGTQELPRDLQEKVGGLGLAPLGLEEFTRWCPQRVVLLQRRSKVAFPTSWGSP